MPHTVDYTTETFKQALNIPTKIILFVNMNNPTHLQLQWKKQNHVNNPSRQQTPTNQQTVVK